ncbi:hypothetical protein EUX98_g9066 [Antrodiella citrinella]|uniref:Tyr recombinase domain-containing protein n=1 Tax=Antrodiella citrinella TaxID=2447956 RepID=A0A4S4LYU0_9APHY|nr:hypothetical protein EUX98_g9066 [Antrodiella citrinella]
MPPSFFQDFLSPQNLRVSSGSGLALRQQYEPWGILETPTPPLLLNTGCGGSSNNFDPFLLLGSQQFPSAASQGPTSVTSTDPPTRVVGTTAANFQPITNQVPPIARPYRPAHAPQPSALRPHCTAAQRLLLWKPAGSIIDQVELEQRIEWVLTHAWASSTRETYGSGILAFHVFCDRYAIPETQRAPASTEIVMSFVATLAGFYAGSTIRNYYSAVRAWHILHRFPWTPDQTALDAILKGSHALAPPSSSRPPRKPVSITALLAIRESLDLSDGRDAAIWACAVCLFYGIARCGELTTPTLTSFSPQKHVRIQNVSLQTDRNGLQVTAIFIPVTKSAPTGEEIFFARQLDLSDPETALRHHFTINNPSDSEHLFAHTFKKTRRPLSKSVFLKRLQAFAHLLDPSATTFTGHSFRIGGTLEYLLRSIPFDVVKTMGRWASNAFQTYLRKHAQILAPYLQGTPAYGNFLHIAMPPVRG